MKFVIKYLITIYLGIVQIAIAQKDPYNHPVCNTRVHDSGYYMRDISAFRAQLQAKNLINSNTNDFTSPYYVRVFIRIVRNDNGGFAACTPETALQNFNEMNGQFNGHNICFQLMGIDYIDDSYLNNFNNDEYLDDVYPTYIRNNNLDVDGAITIFIHYNFLYDLYNSGYAYGIPNNFMSIARWAVNSSNVHSIFGHEMGHCLGLYHTFERYNGSQEAVTRNSGHFCYNCDNEGDLCCDTPADYEDSKDYTNSSCSYNGNRINFCDLLQYNPSTSNIMSYQPWSCISFTSSALTANQRNRMHLTILSPFQPIFFRVAEDNFALTNINVSSNAVRVYSAKFNLTTANGATISHTVSSKAYFAAGNSITFGPGVTLSPGSNGLAIATISGCN